MDEQTKNDRFVKLCGSVAKADRLQSVWNVSFPHGFHDEITREDDFRKKASQEGFTEKQIKAFLDLDLV
jgi:hypothetical protein